METFLGILVSPLMVDMDIYIYQECPRERYIVAGSGEFFFKKKFYFLFWRGGGRPSFPPQKHALWCQSILQNTYRFKFLNHALKGQVVYWPVRYVTKWRKEVIHGLYIDISVSIYLHSLLVLTHHLSTPPPLYPPPSTPLHPPPPPLPVMYQA